MNAHNAEDQPQGDDTADDDQVQPFDDQAEEVTDEDNAGQSVGDDDSNVFDADEGDNGE